MKTKLIAALMTAVILGIGTVPLTAAEGDLGLAGQQVWSDAVTYKNVFPTSYSSAATCYRYGGIIDCRKAHTIEWCVTTSSTGATTYVVVGVEWLLDDPSDPNAAGPYQGVTYYPGYGLLEGPAITTATKAGLDPWTIHEQLALYDTMTTIATSAVNPSTATVQIGVVYKTGLNHFQAFSATKAPYCRPYVYWSVADTGTNWTNTTDAPLEGLVRVSAILRYAPWPDYRQEEYDSLNNAWRGYPWVR